LALVQFIRTVSLAPSALRRLDLRLAGKAAVNAKGILCGTTARATGGAVRSSPSRLRSSLRRFSASGAIRVQLHLEGADGGEKACRVVGGQPTVALA
jgi:hypothetical protein